ncbi:hypothetical protein ACRAWD_03820 [Caulobacter segnis]
MIEALRRPYAIAGRRDGPEASGRQEGRQGALQRQDGLCRRRHQGLPQHHPAHLLVMSRDTLRMLGEADTGQRVSVR